MMAALNAAADFCEGGGCCRRARFVTLFRQPLAPRGTAALPHARCCDGCTALAERRGRDDVGRDVVGADGQIHGSVRDVGEVAVEALRVLGGLNGAAAAAGVTDGGMAPAKLTAVKLCDKLGSKARGVAAAAAAAVAVVVVVVVVPVVVLALVPLLLRTTRRGSTGPSWSEARWSTSCCGWCLRMPSVSTLPTPRTRYVRTHLYVHPASALLTYEPTALSPTGAHLPVRPPEPRVRAGEHSGLHRGRPPPAAAIAHARRRAAAVPEGSQGTPNPDPDH